MIACPEQGKKQRVALRCTSSQGRKHALSSPCSLSAMPAAPIFKMSQRSRLAFMTCLFKPSGRHLHQAVHKQFWLCLCDPQWALPSAIHCYQLLKRSRGGLYSSRGSCLPQSSLCNSTELLSSEEFWHDDIDEEKLTLGAHEVRKSGGAVTQHRRGLSMSLQRHCKLLFSF